MSTTDLRRGARTRGRAFLLGAALAVAGVAGMTACGQDPFAIKWSTSPDTATLYSLARPELGLPSGFDFHEYYNYRGPVHVERINATGRWDVALDTRGGSLVLLPPGALGIQSKARVVELPGRTFDEVVEAPADTTLYSATEPVPVRMGSVYVVRSNQVTGSFGTRCVYYAKLEPLEIDVPEGTLLFVFDSSPVCNDRSLIGNRN
ncbi:MAG: hypothetical protein PVJ02_05060 [Gemmatimonadota bacterium]|jgi:hypothetical protein